MDKEVMEFRMKQWIPIFEAQAKSELGKDEWCEANGITRNTFYKWQREIRKYLLVNNLKMPNIENEYFQTEPDFVEITQNKTAPTVIDSVSKDIVQNIVKDEPAQRLYSSETVSSPMLSIKCGNFSIDINEGTNERLLSMALGVMSNVK